MVSTRDGLGGMIWLSWTTLRTEEIYAVLFVTVGFGLAVNLALAWASRRNSKSPLKGTDHMTGREIGSDRRGHQHLDRGARWGGRGPDIPGPNPGEIPHAEMVYR